MAEARVEEQTEAIRDRARCKANAPADRGHNPATTIDVFEALHR